MLAAKIWIPASCRYFAVGYGTARSRSAWDKLIFAAPYCVLALAVVVDVFQRQRAMTIRPTQMIYDKYLGLLGKYYVSKVAVLQAGSVLLQALGKIRVFQFLITSAIIEDAQFYAATSNRNLWSKVGFWTFLALLSWNCVYPAVLFVFFPDRRWARLGAAVMDVLLDLGCLGLC